MGVAVRYFDLLYIYLPAPFSGSLTSRVPDTDLTETTATVLHAWLVEHLLLLLLQLFLSRTLNSDRNLSCVNCECTTT